MATWEVIEPEPEEMDIEGDNGIPVNVPLPLNISEMANIYAGSIILVAGASNAGKTAFLLSTLNEMLSRGASPTSFSKEKMWRPSSKPHGGKVFRYLNCEMSKGELRARLTTFGTRSIEEWTSLVSFVECTRLFHQAVLPNGVTFVDYLDVTQDFYEAPHLISQIYETLDTGVAIVAMQKPPDREFAIGGTQTIAKPRLVINLDSNEQYGMIAKLVKVKEPVNYLHKPQGRDLLYDRSHMQIHTLVQLALREPKTAAGDQCHTPKKKCRSTGGRCYMTPEKIIAFAKQFGVTLKVNSDGGLAYKGCSDAVDKLLPLLQRHKDGLVQLLSAATTDTKHENNRHQGQYRNPFIIGGELRIPADSHPRYR